MLFTMVEDPISLHRAAAALMNRGPLQGGQMPVVSFERLELSRILAVYGRMVAAGEWRDYALDFLADTAVFSIFRHSSEMALYRIEKRPRARHRQGQYAVIAAGGLVMKRGHDLIHVLKVFDAKLLKALKA